jgi:SAM-dependent methyltransferase
VEVRNGMMSALSNDYARAAGRRTRLAQCGGSDAHTLASVARAFTCVRANDRAEFLASLRAGLTFPAGGAGTYARLTADVTRLTLLAMGHSVREAEDPANVGHVTLARLSKLEPYNRWLVERFRGSLGRRVLEIGAGFGNVTRHLVETETGVRRDLVVASDLDPVAIEY